MQSDALSEALRSIRTDLGVCILWKQRAAVGRIMERAVTIELMHGHAILGAESSEWIAAAHVAHEHRSPKLHCHIGGATRRQGAVVSTGMLG